MRIGIFSALLFCAAAAYAAPANDNFANAQDLSAVAFPYSQYVGSMSTATAEPGEPGHNGQPAARSIWFKFRSDSSKAIGVTEYIGPARLAVYVGGSLAALTPVASGVQVARFPAQPNTWYYIAVDAGSSSAVNIQLRLYPVGGADLEADAEQLPTDLPLHFTGNNYFATASPGDGYFYDETEPAIATVWWKWTAPRTGAVRLDARMGDFWPRMKMFEVVNGSRTQIGSYYVGTAAIRVQAGRTYLLLLDQYESQGAAAGVISAWLEWVPDGPPPNDNFANALDLGNKTVACGGAWLFNATGESGEMMEVSWGNYPARKTVWFKWTCPQSGKYWVSPQGSDGYFTFGVYTGMAVGTSVFRDRFQPAVFQAVAGTTYYVHADAGFQDAPSARIEMNIYPDRWPAPSGAYFSTLMERKYFRLFGENRHPWVDGDGDGTTNEIEMACGANPEVRNPDDPALPRLLKSSGKWQLHWQLANEDGDPAHTPVPETSSHLVGSWTPRASVGTGVYRWVELPSGPSGFVRLRLENPAWRLP